MVTGKAVLPGVVGCTSKRDELADVDRVTLSADGVVDEPFPCRGGTSVVEFLLLSGLPDSTAFIVVSVEVKFARVMRGVLWEGLSVAAVATWRRISSVGMSALRKAASGVFIGTET